ncbi:ShlB/FhaC/HecB family hemolysin secretion/activation protein [Leptolyngbya sp. AN03gr2]|uniref:ShlB/FhaC/HecB family hemolysin secretion/activation protein n=1 Tax=unclassified Leptolyngbya TaxID=2650499 RepID=UPI003D3145F8
MPSVVAQSQPVPPLKPIEQLPKSNPTPLPTQSPPTISPPSRIEPEVLPEIPKKIRVLRYEVQGSTVFAAKELEAVTEKFKGLVTFEQIRDAKAAIEALYRNRKFLTTTVIIPTNQPPLSVNGAVVRVQVKEGVLEDIKVIGTRRLNPSYVRSRLAIAAQKPLNNDRLIEALRLLQQDPLIETVSAELSNGIQPNTSLLEVTIRERQSFNAQLALDNNRSPSIGSNQRRVQLTEGNLLGLGDNITLAYTNTQGSNTIDASYSIPLSPRNTSLSFNFGSTSSRVVEEPFNILDINSKSRYYEVSLRHPLILRAREDSTQELAIGLTGSQLNSETTLLGIPYQLSTGSDEMGRTRISALRFFQEYIQRSNRSVLVARSQFNLGLSILNSTINTNAPDSRFFYWQGQARWFQQLAPETNLILQTKAQLSTRSLVPLEQLAIGGQATVRGYRQDLLLTDNGVLASVELQLPLLKSPTNVVHIAPFFDFGSVWNYDAETTPNPSVLFSTGLGVQWRSRNLIARLDWGIPLVNVSNRRNTWQEKGIYFSVRYFPF